MKNVAHAEHRRQMLHVQQPFGQQIVQYGYLLMPQYVLSMQRPIMPLIHEVHGLFDALSAMESMSIYPQFPHMRVIRQRFEQTQFVNDMPDMARWLHLRQTTVISTVPGTGGATKTRKADEDQPASKKK